MSGEAVERCLACEADGEQGKRRYIGYFDLCSISLLLTFPKRAQPDDGSFMSATLLTVGLASEAALHG